MPNWCTNDMNVSGDPVAVAQFVKDMNGDGATKSDEVILDFNAVIPMPRVLTDRENEDGRLITEFPVLGEKQAWYNWQIAHWGVKWGACEPHFSETYTESDESVSYRYETAWTYPEAWIRTVVAFYPHLTFYFYWVEGGMAFCGEANGVDGVLSFTYLDFEETYGTDDEEEEEEVEV